MLLEQSLNRRIALKVDKCYGKEVYHKVSEYNQRLTLDPEVFLLMDKYEAKRQTKRRNVRTSGCTH